MQTVLTRKKMKSVFSGFRGEAIFAAAMLAAASFGLFKIFLLAAVMPVAIFGTYITAFGGAALLAMLVSFGDTEVTYKSYPQLLASGRNGDMVVSIIGVLRRILLRVTAVFVLAVVFVIAIAPFGLTAIDIGATIVISFVFAMQTLMASIIRAIDAERLLPPFTMARGLSSLLATGAVAVMTESWVAVLLAEGLAQVAVFVVTSLRLRREIDAPVKASLANSNLQKVDHGIAAARYVYLATVIAALIPYGGRSAIAVLEGAAMAGAFGVLSVLVQLAQMLAGALSQKLGPALMREAILRGDKARSDWVQRFGLPVVFLWTASVLVFVGTALSFVVPSAAAFWHGYGITIPILAVASIQMAMSAYLYLFFAVISENRETDLLRAALASVVVFYGGTIASSIFGAGLLGYALAGAAASATQTIYLFLRYREVLRTNA